MLDKLITAALTVGYERIWLDSPDFMTTAHALYRSSGFAEIEPYPESEIPDRDPMPHWCNSRIAAATLPLSSSSRLLSSSLMGFSRTATCS
jgi:hypothetical protein